MISQETPRKVIYLLFNLLDKRFVVTHHSTSRWPTQFGLWTFTSKVGVCLHGSFPNIYSTWGPLSQHSSPTSSGLQLTSTLLIAQECGKRDQDQLLALYSSSSWYRVTVASLTLALGGGGRRRCNRDKL